HTRSDRDWSSDVCSSDLPSLRRMFMRTMFTVILLATLAAAQQTTTLRPNAPDLTPATSSKLIIPSGTKVPLVLKQALSTKNARRSEERRVGKECRSRGSA